MFDYLKKKKPCRMVSIGCARPPIFRPALDGSNIMSFDYSVESSNPDDFSLNALISANVPLENSPEVSDLSLDSLDKLDESVTKVLASEKYFVKED